MKKKILSVLAFLVVFATVAYAIDEKVIMNPKQDGTLKIKVNDSGTIKEAVNVGSTGVVSFPQGVSIDPTTMSDSAATKGGYYTYEHGTTYNGAIAPTVTSTGTETVIRAVFTPYQKQDGNWWLRFSMVVQYSDSSATRTLTVNGVTFKNLSNYQQAFYATRVNGTQEAAYVNPGASTLYYENSVSGTGTLSAGGDIELESKPTWAY